MPPSAPAPLLVKASPPAVASTWSDEPITLAQARMPLQSSCGALAPEAQTAAPKLSSTMLAKLWARSSVALETSP